ncbi:chemotaxis protein CheW [bacterium]|nr:chemotaxis protein CheW [bacterium]
MLTLSDDEILAQRAQELAKPFISHHQSLESTGKINLLVFYLGSESYAIDASKVLEIVPTERMTSLPSLPPFILGVLPVRGMIWSIMDLRIFFNIPRKGICDHPRAILVETSQLRFGILTDSTLDIVSCESLNPPPEISEKIPRNVVRGTINELTIVLDLDVLAQDPRMVVRDDIDS